MSVYNTKAFGKLNLFLNVTGVRSDGYHTIETLFQRVSLCDRIALSLGRGEGIRIKTNKPYIPTDERNLAYKAADAFFAASGMSSGVQINIKKDIPVGAGMAGGSTNAAAVLLVLNRAFGAPLSREQMHELAARLGADVPFCMEHSAALALGIGDVLKPVAQMPPCHIVIAKPPFSVSAKTAYQLFDDFAGKSVVPSANMQAAIQNGDLRGICQSLHNSLEAPVMAQYPKISDIKKRLLDLKAEGAMMTGSGSACFGIFENADDASRAKAKLIEKYKQVYLVTPC